MISSSENPSLFSSKDKKSDSPSLSEKKFRALMQLKYMRSVINPGESVGIIASQSIGEPSDSNDLKYLPFCRSRCR